MGLSAADCALLQRCIELAEHAVGLSDPNPRVGCVLHDAAGVLAGEGFTQQAGGPHAEVMALRAAATAGRDLRGGTAWVSLEPCAHQGRTPPCSDALIAVGLARVVVATTDPFPQVAGQGCARLRAAGIQVDLAEGELARAARELNIGFFSRVQRGRPWVRIKMAASLDGRTALLNGQSQWITGPQAREDGHRWRRRAGALLTGVGTVVADNPRLDVRLVDTARQPLRVVLDSSLRMPTHANILRPPGQTLVIGTTEASAPRADALRAQGADVIQLPATSSGQVPLAGVMALLADRGVNELHVEAGAQLSASWLREGLVDEVLAYVAPKLVGPGQDMVAWPPLQRLDQSLDLQFESVMPVGQDIRILARLPGRDKFMA